jgi:hypothetical protein
MLSEFHSVGRVKSKDFLKSSILGKRDCDVVCISEVVVDLALLTFLKNFVKRWKTCVQ